jgi:hypothetical protein
MKMLSVTFLYPGYQRDLDALTIPNDAHRIGGVTRTTGRVRGPRGDPEPYQGPGGFGSLPGSSSRHGGRATMGGSRDGRPLEADDDPRRRPVCRSIKTLREPYTESVTDDDVRAAALQYVRKISGFRAPSKANREAFEAAVDAVAETTASLLDDLVLPARRPKAAAEA